MCGGGEVCLCWRRVVVRRSRTAIGNKPLEQIQPDPFTERREKGGPEGTLICAKAATHQEQSQE